MPDQNMQNAPELTRDQIEALPVGAVVRDCDGDIYTRVAPDPNHMNDDWVFNEKSWPSWVADDIAVYNPVTLVSVPDDLYQQARIALRDRYGVEPSELDVVAIVDRMEHGNLTPAAAVTFVHHTRAEQERQKQTELEKHSAASTIASTLLIVLVEGADASTQFVVADDTTAGLARLRAHAALDALLDQHGVTR